MTCIKTGAYGRLPDGRIVYGDMHQFPEVTGPYIFRICAVYSGVPSLHILHFDIHTWEAWFDEYKQEDGSLGNSTMVILSHQLTNYGYEGKVIDVPV